jgi:hypothetical protein
MSYPIYYLEIQVSYRKNKNTNTIKTWAVSKYLTSYEIMSKDAKTMDRLNEEFYDVKYKGERSITIMKVLSSKKVGESLFL